MRRLAVASLLLLAACVQLPVRDEVTVEVHPDGLAQITAVTTFESSSSPVIRRRVEEARDAALAGTDAWSARFARLTPEMERVTYERRRGALAGVTREARIHQSDIQRFFSDASLTVSLIDGDGWRELSIYPGTSSRASREQRERFARRMSAWSDEVARYFAAIHHLYSYLDSYPQRAKYVFQAVFGGEEAAVTEDEEPLVRAVTNAMESLGKRMDIEEGDAFAFAEEADLVFNPFPARLTIRVPGEILEARGFDVKGRDAVAERVDIFAAIASLEGQWISPDPVAILVRNDKDFEIEELLALPRKSTAVVTAHEIESALAEKMRRSTAYSVRWRD